MAKTNFSFLHFQTLMPILRSVNGASQHHFCGFRRKGQVHGNSADGRAIIPDFVVETDCNPRASAITPDNPVSVVRNMKLINELFTLAATFEGPAAVMISHLLRNPKGQPDGIDRFLPTK
jgi:hypothetical protein